MKLGFRIEVAATISTAQNITETGRIADQLRRLYDGPSWLGPTATEIIQDIDEAAARRRTLAHAHTIWELVLHIAAWLRIARDRLTATELRDVGEAENWPPMEGSWEEAKSSLETEVHALGQAILNFPEKRLEEQAPAPEAQTFYQLLHGVIQHSAYHAGQIALLKK